MCCASSGASTRQTPAVFRQLMNRVVSGCLLPQNQTVSALYVSPSLRITDASSCTIAIPVHYKHFISYRKSFVHRVVQVIAIVGCIPCMMEHRGCDIPSFRWSLFSHCMSIACRGKLTSHLRANRVMNQSNVLRTPEGPCDCQQHHLWLVVTLRENI